MKLLADTTENVTISTPDVTLDLNGHTLNGGTEKGKPALTVTALRVAVMDSSKTQAGTIRREDTAENSGISSHYVIDIQGKGLLYFNSGNVTNNSGTADGKGAPLVRVGGDSKSGVPGLTINGGTFTQNNFTVIKVNRGSLNLNDGTLNSANSYAIEDWHWATIKGGTVNGKVAAWTYSGGYNSELTIKGGTVNGDVKSVTYDGAEGKTAKVSITGGVVNGTLSASKYNSTEPNDPAKATIEVSGGTFSADPSQYVAGNFAATQNADGKYDVAQAQPIARVGETSYNTMEEAIEAQTASGDAITLLRDYTTGSVFASGNKANRVVDLNGHTWTCTGAGTTFAAFQITYPNASITVKNGKVVSSLPIGLITCAKNDRTGEITPYNNSALTFEGVEASTTATSGIETNGNNTNDTVVLKNSTLNVPNGFGIYFPSSGTLTIDNSKINAKTMGAQVCSGNLNVTAGSAIAVSGDPVKKLGGDGAIQDGAAISIVKRHGYKGLGKVAITGGTFTAKDANAALKAYTWDSSTKQESAFDNSAKTVAVSGGTFSTAVPENCCAEGYIPTQNEDGAYSVKEGSYVAKVDNVKYDSLQKAIDAAKDGSTVRLLADVALTKTVAFPVGKKVDLNLVGHNITATGTALRINGKTDIQDTPKTGTIESTGRVAVEVGDNAQVTVFSGTLKGREGAVVTGKSTGATIEIRGKATLIATDNAVIAGNGSAREGKPNTIRVKGGTLIGGIESTGYIACGIYAPWNDNITVSGGTFNITNGAGIVARAGTVKVTGGTFNCTGGGAGWVGDKKIEIPCAALVFDKDAGYPALTKDSQILVSGGTFSTDPGANGATLADGYGATKNDDGKYKVAKLQPVAAIGNVNYDTLGQAITAAQATAGGATIKLLKSIKTSSYYEVKGDNPVTIDLNGFSITGSGISGLFYVTASGDLTITGEGTVTAVEDNGAAMAVWVRSPKAKVTLAGGTYKQQISNTEDTHFDLIYVERGTAEITGGKYEAYTPKWTLNCKDEYYKSGEANITVTGGTFKSFDPNVAPEQKVDGKAPSFAAPGTGVTKNEDGSFTAAAGMTAQILDKDGNSVKAYSTLAEAVAAAEDGQTVTLLADVTENITIAANKKITLDLNGHILNGGTGTAKAAILNKGTVTITDTSADKTGTIKRDDQGIEGETSYYVIKNIGTMVIDQANVVNNSGYKKTNSSGSMVGTSLICNGDDVPQASLTINGGTFNQPNFLVAKNGTNGTLTVNGGTLTSNHSAVQNWNKAQILGGSLTGQIWTDAWVEGAIGETVIGGDAQFTGEIVVDITGEVPPTLKIEGGSFDVTSWRVTSAAAEANATVAVSGGTFKAAVPAEYCADGFAPSKTTDASGNVTYGVASGLVNFWGGSLRMDTYENTDGTFNTDEADLRFGFNFDLPEGATRKAFGFDWGTSKSNLNRHVNGVNYRDAKTQRLDTDPEGVSGTVSNLVITNIPKANFDTVIYAQMWVTYELNGVSYTIHTDVQSRSVSDIATKIKAAGEAGKISKDSKEYKYASALLS